MVFVFLVLAALYESWALPLAVILVVPVCVACSLAAVWITDPSSAVQSLLHWNGLAECCRGWLKPNDWGLKLAHWIDTSPIGRLTEETGSRAGIAKQDVNIFTQIGFVVLVGLACKNAILIVEFAKVARDKGADLRDGDAGGLPAPARPIMMTSFAFILGVLPLVLAAGPGPRCGRRSASRSSAACSA